MNFLPENRWILLPHPSPDGDAFPTKEEGFWVRDILVLPVQGRVARNEPGGLSAPREFIINGLPGRALCPSVQPLSRLRRQFLL